MTTKGVFTAHIDNPAFETDEDAPQELELRVDYTFYPGSPQTRDDPGSGPEIELSKVTVADTGVEFVLSQKQVDGIKEDIDQDLMDDPGPDPDEAREQAYDDRRHDMAWAD